MNNKNTNFAANKNYYYKFNASGGKWSNFSNTFHAKHSEIDIKARDYLYVLHKWKKNCEIIISILNLFFNDNVIIKTRYKDLISTIHYAMTFKSPTYLYM